MLADFTAWLKGTSLIRYYWSPWRCDELWDFEKDVWNLDIFDWDKKISLCFFCIWFVCSLLFLDIFPTQFTWKCFKSFLHMNTHIYKVILVICVEKSSRWNSRWENIRKKKHKHFSWIPVKDVKIPELIFFKIQKIIKASWASVIAHKDLRHLIIWM